MQRNGVGVPNRALEVIAQDRYEAVLRYDACEHARDGRAIKNAGMDSEAHDPPRNLIHDDHDPMRFQSQ